jgi:hypothetical protein
MNRSFETMEEMQHQNATTEPFNEGIVLNIMHFMFQIVNLNLSKSFLGRTVHKNILLTF